MERNRIVTIFSLLFVLGMVNMAVGGPRALPTLPHDIALAVFFICSGLSLLLGLVLAIDGVRTTQREVEEEVQRELAAFDRKEEIERRKRGL